MWGEWATGVGSSALTRFPVLGAGMMGRSAGGYPADYSTPGHELGLVWRFRSAYLANLGLSALDGVAHVSGGEDARPITVMILQVRAGSEARPGACVPEAARGAKASEAREECDRARRAGK